MRLRARRVSGRLPPPLPFRRPPRCGSALLLALTTLRGCAELPVPARAPYGAAPPLSSAPWRPPPGAAADRPRVLPGRGTPIVDPNAVYGVADLIDFAHRANPETRRVWEEARAAAAQVGR